MYRVLIVDDESIVRMGIRDLIEWEDEGFEVCGEGKDGRDGLAKVLALQPDLVLVDIKMPGLSGIDLIREAREQGYQGHFIILTGYSEFEFAKSAITYGVREYLLKPIDEDELQKIVHTLGEELRKKEGEQIYHENNEQAAKEELLRRILLKLEPRETLRERMKLYQMKLDDPILCAAVLHDRDLVPGQENDEFIRKTRELQAGSRIPAECLLMDQSMVLVNQGCDYRTWAEELDRQNQRIKRKYGKGFSIAVGHNVSAWYDLAHSYEFASFLMRHEFLFDGGVLTIDSIAEQKNAAENPSVDYFCMLIEVGDLQGIRDCVEIFHTYCLREMLGEMEIKIMVMYNLMQIKNWADKHYGASESTEITASVDRINHTEGLDELLNVYLEVLQGFCSELGYQGSETVIKRMYYYMERNYEKDLKLETFARMFNYNSNYLGKVFRKEIGDSFNNILDSIRISNAKQLLAETDLKVYQISERVGYSNIDYFYLKFKKYVGMSPKEYKRQTSSD